MKVVLERYHGLSNDYVVFDPNKNELELTPGNVKMICDRDREIAKFVPKECRTWSRWSPGRSGYKRRRHACQSMESGWK